MPGESADKRSTALPENASNHGTDGEMVGMRVSTSAPVAGAAQGEGPCRAAPLTGINCPRLAVRQ